MRISKVICDECNNEINDINKIFKIKVFRANNADKKYKEVFEDNTKQKNYCQDYITTIVKKMGVKCLGGKESSTYRDKSLCSKVYADIYDQLKQEFGVSTYKSIKRNQCDMAVYIVETYQLSMVLAEEINDCNAQEVFV